MNRALALVVLCLGIALCVGSCGPPTVEEKASDTELEAWRVWQESGPTADKPKAPAKAPTPPAKPEPPKVAPKAPKVAPKAPDAKTPATPPAKAPAKKVAAPAPKPATPPTPAPKKPVAPKAPSKVAATPKPEPEAAPAPKPKAAPTPPAKGKAPEKPKTAEAPKAPPKPKAPEKPAPPPPPPAPSLYMYLPQKRSAFAAGETAEVTLVVANPAPVAGATLSLALTNDTGTTWRATERLDALQPGRHAMTYTIATGSFVPGAYTLTAQLGEASFGRQAITLAPSVAPTHFPIAAWLEKRPRHALDAARLSQAIGLNTVLLQRRSPWLSAPQHRLGGDYAEAVARLHNSPTAKPLESGKGAPPFIRTADLLTGAGLRWINVCAVSGGGLPTLAPDRDFVDPLVMLGARQRIHHKLLAERAFANCRGIHFTSETALGAHDGNPFGSPARIAAFQRVTGLKAVTWRDGAKKWEPWQKFVTFRAGILGACLADWTQAVHAIEPGYLAASQFGDGTNLAAGVYPPLQTAGLPLVVTQSTLNGPAGMDGSLLAAELARAGQWAKPVWFMPQVDPDADLDEVRASLHLAMARKLDGIVYPPGLDYHYDQPKLGSLATDLLAGISGLNRHVTELGDFLQRLERVRDPVAILYSVTEHTARIGRDPAGKPQGADYTSTITTAYQACMLAHFPASFLTEEELLAGQADPVQAILVIGLTRVRPEVKAKLEAFAAGDGVVLVDPTTTVKLEGADALGLEFPSVLDYFAHVKSTVKDDEALALERRDEMVRSQLFGPILGPLRAALKKHLQRDYTVSSPSVLVCEQRAGDARYYFVVNNTQTMAYYRGLNVELQPTAVRLILRSARRLYDVVGGARIEAPSIKGRPVVPLVLPAGGMDIIADLPDEVGGVRIRHVRARQGTLDVSAHVFAGKQEDVDWGTDFLRAFGRLFVPARKPKPINAVVPIEVIVRDPDGVERLHLFRAHTPDGYTEAIPFPDYQKPGKWTLIIRDRLGDTSAEETFRVRPHTSRWAHRQGSLVAFDGDRVAALLRSDRPLSLVVGTEDEAAMAEALAAALSTEERPVAVKLAKDLARPRKLDAPLATRYLSPAPSNSPMPDIRSAVVLVGNIATHPLLQAVHNYGLLPRQVSPDYPGPGGALVCWLTSVFEPDAQVVVAAAADAAGVRRALDVLTAAASGRAPATAYAALGSSAATAGATHERKEEVTALIKPQWTQHTLDTPTDAAAAITGDFFVVGFHDGQVVGYDTAGSANWRYRCSSRVRDVAISADGAWSAAASFPEATMLTARGRAQWVAPLRDTSRRADFTCVALGVSGMNVLAVAGTRAGGFVGLDSSGQQVFALGAEIIPQENPLDALLGEKDKKPAESPPARTDARSTEAERLGTVSAIAVSAGVDYVVVGAERETLIVAAGGEQPGKEIWASAKFQRVTSIVINDEKSLIALGSRDGYVACIEPDGTLRWRVPADGYVMSVCFQGGSDHIIAASLGGTLTCYDGKGKMLWQHASPVGFRFVASSDEGDVIAAAQLSGKAILLHGSGEVFAETTPLRGVVRAMAFSSAGNYLLIGTSANEVSFFKHERPRLEEDDL